MAKYKNVLICCLFKFYIKKYDIKLKKIYYTISIKNCIYICFVNLNINVVKTMVCFYLVYFETQ